MKRANDRGGAPRFGEIAVRKGYVTPGDLERALGAQRDVGRDRLVGEILLERGLLSPWEVEDVLITLADLAAGSTRSGETPCEPFMVGPELFSGSTLYARRERRRAVAVPRRTAAARLVRDVMEPPLVTTLDAPLGAALDAAFEVEAEAVLVEGRGRLVGVLPVWAFCQHDRETPVGEVLEVSVPSVSAWAPASEAVRILGQSDAPCVAVMAGGDLAGIVSRRSLRRAGMSVPGLEDEVVQEELGVGG